MYTSEASIAGFDADEVVEAVTSVVGERLLAAVEYDREGFNTLLAAEPVVELYGGPEGMREQFDRVHDYVALDFMERDVIEDAFVATGVPRAFATYTEQNALVRLLAEASGLFLALEPDADVTGVVSAAASVTRGEGA